MPEATTNATTQTGDIDVSCPSNCCIWVKKGSKRLESGRMAGKSFTEIVLRHPEYVKFVQSWKGERKGLFLELFEFMESIGLVDPRKEEEGL